MGKKIIALSLFLALGILPIAAFAQVTLPPRPQGNQPLAIAGLVDRIFAVVWPITVSIVILMFIYAGILFLTAAGSQGQVDTAKKAFVWGAVGVGVIVVSFSMIFVVRSILGVA